MRPGLMTWLVSAVRTAMTNRSLSGVKWRKRYQVVSDEYIRGQHRERLGCLSAIIRAQERRDEVLAAVAFAESDEKAQEAVAALLDLDEPVHAVAVLDMQLRRMPELGRQRVRAEYDELRAALDDRR